MLFLKISQIFTKKRGNTMKYDYIKALDNERKNTLSKLEYIENQLESLEKDKRAGDISQNLYNQTKTQLIQDRKDVIALARIHLEKIKDDFIQFVDEWNVIKGSAITDDAKLIQANMKLTYRQIQEKMNQYKYNPTMAQMFYDYGKTFAFVGDNPEIDFVLSADEIKGLFTLLCDKVKNGIIGSKLSYDYVFITDAHFKRILSEKFTDKIDIREMDKYIQK